MKIFRRILLFFLLLTSIVCIVLLLNFTASNPTGRRYSSASPIITGQGDTQQIGLSGEKILSADIRLPRNEDADQRQCICNNGGYTPTKNECLACFAASDQITTYRRPDFVGPGFIAESKNARNLLYSGREVDQIGDYVLISRLLGYPLWVFVRANTLVDFQFTQLVQSTGGDVIYYFTVPGFVDPVDFWSVRFLSMSLVLIVLLLAVEWLPARSKRFVRVTPVRPPSDPYLRKADDAQDFINWRKDKLKNQMDTDDHFWDK